MEKNTLFLGVTLVDGCGGPPVQDAWMRVEGETIADVGAGPAPEVSRETEIKDCRGRFMIPGLIDCHIHMDLHGFSDTFRENLVEDKLRTLRAAQEMGRTLKAGFTTVRNVGSVNHIDFAVKEAVETGLIQGPRIVTSGRIISMTCSGTEYFKGMYRIADGVDECRKAAREQIRTGADCLKLMATGAVMNPGGVPGAPQLDVAEMAAVVMEGEKLGLHTAAHAHGARGIVNAVQAGVHTIEHGTMADDTAIEMMARHRTFLIPTLSLHDLFEAHKDTVPSFMLEKSRKMQQAYVKIVKKAVRAGVRVAMGTDAGTNYNYHGNNAAEIVFLVKHGIMSPMEAITAATKTAAGAIMTVDRVGTLEKGKYADFILLERDPLNEIEVLSKVDDMTVFKGGKQVS